MITSLQHVVKMSVEKIKTEIKKFIINERGEMVATLGWMALAATMLVLVHGLITGWLPTFIDRIFSRMDTLV